MGRIGYRLGQEVVVKLGSKGLAILFGGVGGVVIGLWRFVTTGAGRAKDDKRIDIPVTENQIERIKEILTTQDERVRAFTPFLNRLAYEMFKVKSRGLADEIDKKYGTKCLPLLELPDRIQPWWWQREGNCILQ